MDTAPVSFGLSGVEDGDRTEVERRELVVTARWALIFGCAYLMLFGDAPVRPASLGVIAVFLASNFLLGRTPMKQVGQQRFALGVAASDTILIGLSLYLAGQLNVELLALFLGVLVLAIAGLPLWGIAAATVGMSAMYLVMVWAATGAAVWQWSTLLRAPFLLGAALVYASLLENRGAGHRQQTPELMAHGLALQLEAIRRCQAALTAADSSALAALREVERHNRTLQANLKEQTRVDEAEPITAVAHSVV